MVAAKAGEAGVTRVTAAVNPIAATPANKNLRIAEYDDPNTGPPDVVGGVVAKGPAEPDGAAVLVPGVVPSPHPVSAWASRRHRTSLARSGDRYRPGARR
ncbi:hypothetical protein GCM10023193_44460 [Planotetraspora kaengkrachanensis]|uniref:Uncharacterized protein n=1 Tax=Planotetraspora kaengkrachanensis TaxID=575193 RepID=A0A8J3VB73_9ACTN|nr:hypothetical protein Pka01_65110 [Planotetraspora kaengkrachanensis]